MGWPKLGEYACLTDGWWGSWDTKQGFWDNGLVLDKELFPGSPSFDVFLKNYGYCHICAVVYCQHIILKKMVISCDQVQKHMSCIWPISPDEHVSTSHFLAPPKAFCANVASLYSVHLLSWNTIYCMPFCCANPTLVPCKDISLCSEHSAH